MEQRGDLPILTGSSEHFNMHLCAHATSSADRENCSMLLSIRQGSGSALSLPEREKDKMGMEEVNGNQRAEARRKRERM